VRLAELIRWAWRSNSVIVAYVYGNFGSGKTSYALWTAYEVLGDWGRVLGHLFFDPAEAAAAMRRAIERRRRLPIVIMDDAGLWLDRMTWWESEKVAFMQFFNLIRSVTAGIIFTTPTEELPKQILRKSVVRVKVEPVGEEHARQQLGDAAVEAALEAAARFGVSKQLAIATGYVVRTLPDFTQLVSKQFYDLYPLHYPIHEQYEAKRHRALKHYFEKWSAMIGRRHSFESYRERIAELLSRGAAKREIARMLRSEGVPKATAYYWIRLVEEGLSAAEHQTK
jgi:hypothetical protein